MQMCSTWFSAKTELVLNCLKADLSRHELLQQRKRADGSPWGLLCRNHCRWNPWELCFECMAISTCGLLVSWYWHIRLVDPIDIRLCVSHPEGSHQWELSQCLPGEMSWPGDCWLKEIFAKFFLPLCASKRLSNTSHDENVTMVCRNPGFSLCLCHGLYRMLSKPHRPNCSAMTTSCFILCARAASHCSAQS